MFEFLGDTIKSLAKPRLTENILINDEELARELSDGTVERVRWQDLTRVTIVTTDQGPWFEDVFFVFEADSAGIVISHEWVERVKIFDWLKKKLSGVDFGQVIQAMACTDNATFLLWDAGKPGCSLE
jgi:hypothetical protein